MKKYLKDICGGFYSLVLGLRVTLAQFFKPTVTVHYPHESLKMTPRFRGHIELVRDPQTGKAICMACKLCEKTCPSHCITVEGVKREGEKHRSLKEFKLDFTKCSLCGSCVEVCKSQAIRFSKDYNLAGTSKEDFIMDLFKRLEAEQVAEAAQAAASPSAKQSEAKPAEQPRTEVR